MRVILIKKSTLCQKVTVHKDKKPFISNLKKPVCASKPNSVSIEYIRVALKSLVLVLIFFPPKNQQYDPGRVNTLQMFIDK